MTTKLDPILAAEMRTKLRLARRLMQDVHDDLMFETVDGQRVPRAHTRGLGDQLETMLVPLAGITDDISRLALPVRRKR